MSSPVVDSKSAVARVGKWVGRQALRLVTALLQFVFLLLMAVAASRASSQNNNIWLIAGLAALYVGLGYARLSLGMSLVGIPQGAAGQRALLLAQALGFGGLVFAVSGSENAWVGWVFLGAAAVAHPIVAYGVWTLYSPRHLSRRVVIWRLVSALPVAALLGYIMLRWSDGRAELPTRLLWTAAAGWIGWSFGTASVAMTGLLQLAIRGLPFPTQAEIQEEAAEIAQHEGNWHKDGPPLQLFGHVNSKRQIALLGLAVLVVLFLPLSLVAGLPMLPLYLFVLVKPSAAVEVAPQAQPTPLAHFDLALTLPRLRLAVAALVFLVLCGMCSMQLAGSSGGARAQEPTTPVVGVVRSNVPATTPAIATATTPAVAGSLPAVAGATAPLPATAIAQPGASPVEALLDAYYTGLNSGTFVAKHYFEPSVERFITFIGTDPGAIDAYIHGGFTRQFKEVRFEREPGSLREEAPGAYTYVEHSKYFEVSKRKTLEKRAGVRIRLGSSGKLSFLQQFRLLPTQ